MYGCNGTNAKNVDFDTECPYCEENNEVQWEMCCEEETDTHLIRCAKCSKLYFWKGRAVSGRDGYVYANTHSVEEYYSVDNEEEFVAEYGADRVAKELAQY